MSVVQNIIGMVRDIHDRQENSHIMNAVKNNLNDPNAAVAAAMQINPQKGFALQKEYADADAAKTAAEDAVYKNKVARLGVAFKMLRGVPHEQVGAAFDQFTPLFSSLGVDPSALAAVRAQAEANPDYLASLDDDAYKNMSTDQYKSTVATPGSHVLRGGKVIDEVPVSYKPVTAGSAQTGYTTATFDPNTGQWGTPDVPHANMVHPDAAVPAESGTPGWTDPGATGLTAEALLPHFGQQESHGDYTAHNLTTGALGKYQILPSTGRTLAKRAGLAWRPDMMTSDDPASQRYQDKLGLAAAQEAVDHSSGDPATAFSYYHGGSDRSKWGPKTAQYTSEMLARTGFAPAPAGGRAVVDSSGIHIPAAPQKPEKHVRAASPQEIADAGYPAGTAAQVDETGKFVNIHTPPAAKAGAKGNEDPLSTYHTAKDSINDIRSNLIKLRDDPGLNGATGMYGKAMSYIPGTHAQYLSGLADQINAQKLVGLATALKASGGNPFQRITNMEAQQLPKTLGNFSLSQNPDDLKRNISDALKQLDALDHRLDEGAQRTGVLGQQGGGSVPIGTIIRNPKTGARKQMTAQGWKDL